jgi:hypothetical protein
MHLSYNEKAVPIIGSNWRHRHGFSIDAETCVAIA